MAKESNLYKEILATIVVLGVVMLLFTGVEYIRYRKLIASPICTEGEIVEIVDKHLKYRYTADGKEYEGIVSYYGVKDEVMLKMRYIVLYSSESPSESTMFVTPQLSDDNPLDDHNCDDLAKKISIWSF